MNRGRSRQVSSSAIARRASHERRSFPDPSSSMSPHDDFDHPETLEDQVHIAYADDNLHLAKILLLRLKGIEVTGDNDPRIGEVQDEDFDYCFAPHGRLVMDASDEKALLEQQRIELDRQRERQRIARLRACEQKWAAEKRRLREERLKVVRKRELRRAEEEQCRQREERTRFALEDRCQEAHLFQLASYTRRPPQNSSDDDERPTLFVHDLMITPPLTPRRRQPTSPLARATTRFATPTYDESSAVAFTQVLASMQGPLFPLTHEERTRRTQSPAAAKPRSRSRSKGPSKASHSQVRRRKEADLLQSLLVTPPPSEDRRWSCKSKGKAVLRPKIASGVCSECRRSPSTSSSEVSSPSSSTSSRPSSWLSFGSSASASSVGTSPPSSPSPRSSWFKSSPSPSHRGSWLSTPLVSPPSPIERLPSHDDHECRCHLSPINISDSPLFFDSELSTALYTAPKPYTTSVDSALGGGKGPRRRRTVSSPGVAAALISNVTASVTQLVELAKGFQHAYVAAAMFSVAASYDGDRWEEREVAYEYDEVKGLRVVVGSYENERGRVGGKGRNAINEKAKDAKTRMKPFGYRVSPKDVATFLDAGSCCLCAAVGGSVSDSGEDQGKGVVQECGHFPSSAPEANKYVDIPLGSPCAPRQEPPSTVLPKTLPYKLYFTPIPAPSQCPFRFNAFSQVHTTYPEQEPVPDLRPHNPCSSGVVGGVQWRIRSIGNPAHLRLRALQNVLWRRGHAWEGRGRELSLGGGKDRVVGIAYEGAGCSKLSRGCSS